MSEDPPTASDESPDSDPTLRQDAVADSTLQIGPYHLRQKIGEGGMGEVWLAEQSHPIKRKVALKIIKRGMDSKEVVSRFEAERQALALMSHPFVAKVYEAGTTPSGSPYFAMEYVPGTPITEHCDRQKLNVRERLELFCQVCEGVQHAHQKAIIHRDLKPGNVLVTERDGKRIPAIIDFGVAKATAQKLTEQTMFTQLGVLLGTPEYMSPEQAEMTGEDVDTRTDVYSLGVILYELLVGALPFDSTELRGAGVEGIRRMIREDDPPRPSTRVSAVGEQSTNSARARQVDLRGLRHQLKGDLDWITMRALEKDRARRYSSPMELAADIGRHLEDKPVLAGPPSQSYRLGKFFRRNKLGVIAATAVLLALVGGLGAMGFGLTRATRAEREASEKAATAEAVSDFLVELFLLANPVQTAGEVMTVKDLLDQGVERLEEGFADQPAVRLRMASVMGQTYQGLGFPEDSFALYTVALDLALASLGEDHLMTLNARSDLSWIYYKMGDYDSAAEQILLVIPRLREQFGDGERTMEAKALLGRYYSQDRQLEAADSLLIEALEYFESTYGDDHYQTLKIKGWLVSVRKRQGRIDEAATFATEAFEGVRRSFGAEHPVTLDRMNALAGVYARQGRSVEAEELYLECLALFRQAVGSDHAGTSNVCDTLGRFYLEQERYAEAESLLVEALEIRRNTLGPSHRGTIWIVDHLVRVYRGQHRRADAYRLTRDTIDDRRRAIGDEAGSVRYALYDLACFAALNGNRVEALDWLSQAADAGWHDIDLTVQAPDFESLRGDDEFETLVERIRDNAALDQAGDAASN